MPETASMYDRHSFAVHVCSKGGLTRHSLTMMKLNLQDNARKFNYWSVAVEKT
jgi:hypothetical protein